MEYIFEYGLFLAQAITFVAAFLIVVAGVITAQTVAPFAIYPFA